MSQIKHSERGSVGDAPEPSTGMPARRSLESVPDPAFLQPEDLGGVEPRSVTDEFARHLRPPLPSGSHRYPSLLLRRAEGAILIDYPVGDFHTTLLEHVTYYRGATAAAYMRDLRVAVSRRAGCTDDTGRWTLEQVGVGSPPSMLIRLRQEFADPSGQPAGKDSWVLVARTDRAVVVLADIGWEMGSGHPGTIRSLADAALRRAATVR